jgi:Domain of unknown function (DUF4386)
MFFLRLHDYGVFANEIFWGLWLFPFGLLVWRSGFIPRILGLCLFVACFGYLAFSFTGLLMPHYLNTVARVANIAILGEAPIILARDHGSQAEAAGHRSLLAPGWLGATRSGQMSRFEGLPLKLKASVR